MNRLTTMVWEGREVHKFLIKVPTEVNQEIEAKAKRERKSKSVVVNELLSMALTALATVGMEC